jgi:hypothetical protein
MSDFITIHFFVFPFFCCLKNRRNNRFVFFFFKARLPLHWLAGGAWNLQAPVCCSARTLSMAKPSDAAAGQERQVQGRVVCSMKACARASKVFWFIGAGMIYRGDRLTAGAG